MRISAKADYAVRAAVELATAAPGGPTKIEAISRAQDIPHKFLESILNDMRRAGLVASVRGTDGGYLLHRDPSEVSVADIVRAVDGPLVSVRGERPPDLTYTGAAIPLLPLWIALRANVRSVLEEVTLAHLAAGRLPDGVQALTADAQAWENP